MHASLLIVYVTCVGPIMQAIGHRVMAVSPRYDQYKDAWDTSVVSEVLRTLRSLTRHQIQFPCMDLDRKVV